MAETKYLGPDGEATFHNNGATEIPSGAVVQLPDGRAGIVTAARGIPAGKSGTTTTRGRYRINAVAADVHAAGDVIHWDNDEAVAAGTGFAVGTAEVAKEAGETSVNVILNKAAL